MKSVVVCCEAELGGALGAVHAEKLRACQGSEVIFHTTGGVWWALGDSAEASKLGARSADGAGAASGC